MLRSLEKLGLVLSVPDHRDARRRLVSLTVAGLTCIRHAIKSIIRRRKVTRAFDTVLTLGLHRSMSFVETVNAESICSRIRRGFGDTATLAYYWHPDD